MLKHKLKKTEIGKVLKDWEVVKLNELITLETGKREKGGGLEKGKIASLGGEHIGKDGRIIWGDMKFITEDFYNSLTQGKVVLNDILLVKDGATTGKIAFTDKLRYKNVAVNEHVFIIRSKEEIINKFLFYTLSTKRGQAQIRKNFHGIIGGIGRDDIREIEILLPPLPEQRAIAQILSTVDDAIAKVDLAIAKSERLKKGLMQQLLTKGIGHKKFKKTEIGEVPEGWEVQSFGNLITEYIGGGTPSTSKPEYWNGHIPWMTSAFILDRYVRAGQKYITEEGLENSATHLIKKNNLIIATRVGIGKSAINLVDVAISQDLTGVIIDKQRAEPEFIYWFLKANVNKLKSLAQGSTIKGILKEDLGKLKLGLPNLEEQKKIVQILASIENKVSNEKSRKQKLERIKKGLMDDLLIGRRRLIEYA